MSSMAEVLYSEASWHHVHPQLQPVAIYGGMLSWEVVSQAFRFFSRQSREERHERKYGLELWKMAGSD